jgi:penicillin-binding protein 1A
LTVCRDCPEPGSEELQREPLDLEEVQMEAAAIEPTDEPVDLRTLHVSPVYSESGEQARPRAPRIMSPETAFIMDSMLKDVIKKGTGRKALAMKRGDIAGKTGTTNGPRDAWFSGYSPHLATSTWVGFDSNDELGKNEYGGSAALPIWIDFMTTVRINPNTGRRTSGGGMFEIFRADRVPGRESYRSIAPVYSNDRDPDNSQPERERESLPEELF